MQRARLSKRAVLACCLLALLPAIPTVASGALVEVNDLILRADAGYRPHRLPRRQRVPIEFSGFVSFAGKQNRPPPALQRVVIDFDHDGRVNTSGLARCSPHRIETAGTREARRACRRAIVGRGKLRALVLLPGGAVEVHPTLTVFNGPRVDGHPTAVIHARTEVPVQQTYAIAVPISRRRGDFRYRAAFDVPPIAGGLGRVTRLQVHLGRRYRAHGKRRSYLSARCSDSIQRIRGHFTFDDGTIVAGALERFCDPR